MLSQYIKVAQSVKKLKSVKKLDTAMWDTYQNASETHVSSIYKNYTIIGFIILILLILIGYGLYQFNRLKTHATIQRQIRLERINNV